VGIQAAPRGIKVTKNTKKMTSPAKSVNSTVIAKSRRHTAKSVANLIARNKYRPDLLPVSIHPRPLMQDTRLTVFLSLRLPLPVPLL
jgi:hypothetical protein